MSKAKKQADAYWVDKSITCNGCKYLNFYRCGCRRNQTVGQVHQLSSFRNADDYIAVIKPTDCDYEHDSADKSK